MPKKQSHFLFTLVLQNVTPHTDSLEDSLFECGCDDALLNFKGNTVYLDFERTGNSLEEAILSAIENVESSSVKAVVTAVTPEDIVTEADIAKRLHKNRQLVSLWTKGIRRTKHSFPSPIMKLSDRSACWRWREVTAWLHKNNMANKEDVENANFLANINAALEERDPEVRRTRRRILKALLG